MVEECTFDQHLRCAGVLLIKFENKSSLEKISD